MIETALTIDAVIIIVGIIIFIMFIEALHCIIVMKHYTCTIKKYVEMQLRLMDRIDCKLEQLIREKNNENKIH